MALTSVVVNRAGRVPRLLTTTAVAVDTADAKGVTISTETAYDPPVLVAITGDVAWAWADNDLVAFANMSPVPAGIGFVLQTTPGSTQNFYIKTATTCNITVIAIGQ